MNNQKDKLKTLSQALRDNLKRRMKSTKKKRDNIEIKNKVSKIVLSLMLICLLVSCSKNLETVGYFVNKSKLDSIKVNKSSKQEVLDTLGEPTAKSTFPPEAYYYIERQYERIAFLTPKLKEQKVISIEFNKQDIVTNLVIYDKDSANSLNYDSEKITFEGNKISGFKQIFENIGRFNSKAQKRSIR